MTPFGGNSTEQLSPWLGSALSRVCSQVLQRSVADMLWASYLGMMRLGTQWPGAAHSTVGFCCISGPHPRHRAFQASMSNLLGGGVDFLGQQQFSPEQFSCQCLCFASSCAHVTGRCRGRSASARPLSRLHRDLRVEATRPASQCPGVCACDLAKLAGRAQFVVLLLCCS